LMPNPNAFWAAPSASGCPFCGFGSAQVSGSPSVASTIAFGPDSQAVQAASFLAAEVNIVGLTKDAGVGFTVVAPDHSHLRSSHLPLSVPIGRSEAGQWR
jgi:hypothetical protein